MNAHYVVFFNLNFSLLGWSSFSLKVIAIFTIIIINAIFQALIEVITSSEGALFNRAVILLGELLYMVYIFIDHFVVVVHSFKGMWLYYAEDN